VHIIAEVTGSSPVPPTIALVLGQDLPLSVVLEALLGPDEKRMLGLRHMQNEELFKLYDSGLGAEVAHIRLSCPTLHNLDFCWVRLGHAVSRATV
jgi:hypothetical protein